MKTGAQLITEERERQISQEGWTPEHDATHNAGELVEAAFAYVGFVGRLKWLALLEWPWDIKSFKPDVKDPIRTLVKAGALIAAEIDRLSELLREGGR